MKNIYLQQLLLITAVLYMPQTQAADFMNNLGLSTEAMYTLDSPEWLDYLEEHPEARQGAIALCFIKWGIQYQENVDKVLTILDHFPDTDVNFKLPDKVQPGHPELESLVTPLSQACFFGKVELVQKLLQAGADPTQTDGGFSLIQLTDGAYDRLGRMTAAQRDTIVQLLNSAIAQQKEEPEDMEID